MSKLKSKIVKWLMGIDLEKLKQSQNNPTVINEVQHAGLNESYLFDFKNWSSQYNGASNGILIGSPNDSDSSISTKIKVKPIDVLNELETVPNPFSLTLIDEKIDILKDKVKLIVQHYANRVVVALFERLENRKKYSF